jgi:hypothetical protein
MTKPDKILIKKNNHVRDNNIKFYEQGHKYSILSDPHSKYTSVTTWNHSHFAKFNADEVIKKMMKSNNWKEGHKYWGLSPYEIKTQWSNNGSSVSQLGTDLHNDIECFMNNKGLNTVYSHEDLYNDYINSTKVISNVEPVSVEWQYFINFVKDNKDMKPYRTEWTIYDEDLKLAGSIDMVYENLDGSLSIYDWKRSKDITRISTWNKFAITESINNIPDSNFWHYALQLNTYKSILERKYEKKVKDLYLVRLHPDAENNNYDLIKIPDLKEEMEVLFIEILSSKNA